MSSKTAISMIETVKNKLQKYIALEQNDKVKEYLLKLQNTTIDPALLQETKIDELVGQLASNGGTSYSSTAKSLIKKWQDKNLSSKPTNSSKVKTITNTSKTVAEKKLAVKRKSIDDDVTHSSTLSESQSSDEYRSGDRDQTSSNKKRKVLSLAEYVGNKKPTLSSTTTTTTIDSNEKKLTDTQVQEIYAQFNANIEGLAAKAPDLATNVNKKLTQKDVINNNRNDFIVNGHNSKTIINEKQKTKHDDIWEEDDDDDDDDDDSNNNDYKQSQSNKNNQTVNNNKSNNQQIKKSTIKTENHSMLAAIGSSIASFEHPQSSTRSSQPQPTVPSKKSDNYNFLRSKQGRQAIYSGKRATRTTIPSLQDLCVETLKDNIDVVCRTHFNRLPYDVVKPILDSANPDQLQSIVDYNPDYVDDVELLWKHFCALHYKDVQREENETYYELYWRKFNENEERLRRLTQLAKRRKEETVDTARQTKPLNIRQTTNRHVSNPNKVVRQVVGLPPSKPFRGQAKVKKPTMPPLLKKTLKFFNGKS